MQINHIGYAVKRLDRAQSEFEKLGFQFDSPIDDSDRNIKLVFGRKDGYCIELVTPLDKQNKSPVDCYLSNSVGTPYHICYESENMDNEIEVLTHQGFKVIVEPKPAIAFCGKRVVFLYNIGFGIMEIVEKRNE